MLDDLGWPVVAGPQDPTGDGPSGPSDGARRAQEGGLRGGVVAIIDDDVWVRESMMMLLETHGFTPVGYASGAEFLADAGHRDIAYLIVDYHMPDMNGLDLLAALHREGHHAPALLITGRLDPGVAERAGRLGVQTILEKPFAVDRMVDLVRTGLRGHA